MKLCFVSSEFKWWMVAVKKISSVCDGLEEVGVCWVRVG